MTVDQSVDTGPGQTLVLVVDDEISMRLLAREALEVSGFQVEEAAEGETAISLFQKLRPDLVLLDVMMGGMDGFEVCSTLQALPGGDSTPIVMMTGLDDTTSIDRAYTVGATDFVTKPINYPLLAYRLRYIARVQYAMAAAREGERRLADAQRLAQLGHWEWDTETNHVLLSERVCQIFGIPNQASTTYDVLLRNIHPGDRDSVARKLERAIHEALPVSLEHRVLLPNGSVRIVYQEAASVSDQTRKTPRLVGTAQDITRRKNREQRILQLAYYDDLTELPNRTFFKEHLGYLIKIAKRYDRRIAILSFDLDLFKRVNDSMGHNAGDLLLKLVAERVTGCLRRSDFIVRKLPPGYEKVMATGGDAVIRLGGDEFIILLSEINRDEDAAVVAGRVRDTLAKPFLLDGQEVFITTSIGISLYPRNGVDPDDLLKKSDMALYHAKEKGRNSFHFYSDELNAEALELLAIGNDLHRALEREELLLHFQPKIELQSGRVTGVEALLRWQHPQRGMIPPARFIPLAEEAGLICEFGQWALETACRQAQSWQDSGLAPLRIAVNLSAHQLRQEDLAQIIDGALQNSRLDSRWLEVEVTEGQLMEDVEAASRILATLKQMGLYIALDDFGTGYSSLSYLKRLPIDSLKIDRSFVFDITTDADSAAVVAAIMAMAKSLGLRVVAEGVETEQQLAALAKGTCNEIQGYLISKPLPADEFEAWYWARSSSPEHVLAQ